MYGECWHLKLNVSETKYLKYQQNIEGNSSFRMWKCDNFISSLAPLARIYYIHFLNVSVLLVYCRLYYYHTIRLVIMKVHWLSIMYAGVIWDLKINVFERKYLNYQQNDEGNKSLRLWKCQKKLSSLAYSCFWGACSRNITAASIHFSDWGGGGAAKVEKCPPQKKKKKKKNRRAPRAKPQYHILKLCMFSGIFMLRVMVL